MTALFLMACIIIISGIATYSYIQEKKFDEENPVSDYIRGLRRHSGIIEDACPKEMKILCVDVARDYEEK